MLEFLKKKKPTQLNNETPTPAKQELSRIRKRITMQAGLAVMTVILTVVIVFGITAAWYTNVVHSGGLIFEVEQMGVNVDATVSSDTFTAKPGDDGIICLEAANDGGAPVDITVSINKANMDEEMQKRLYFYVDAQQTANEETTQRSYLTASEGYTYRVQGGNSLTLTEQYHNASQLKWCWVYDVLGYYVLGQAGDADVEVMEYLRPIEYDYDYATFDENGYLLTVDGVTTLDEFLWTLSLEDGYPGYISTTDMMGQYYEVAVDENGYGVYAYLCTYWEVEANTDYDTALGIAALEGVTQTYSALMTIHAEQAVMDTITVSSEAALLQALEQGQADAIRLGSDVTLSSDSVLYIPAESELLLDLNGHTLSTSASDYAVELEENSSLTITDGNLTGKSAGNAFYMVGADLTLNDVNISGYAKVIQVKDFLGTGQDTTISITDCDIETTGNSILLYGNGSASSQTTKLFIENSTLTSDCYVISGNGSVYGDGRWGTEIEIINSTLTQNADRSVYAAIYHPQGQSTMNIYGSTISGYTGIAIKGGTVTIVDSMVMGVGKETCEPVLMTNGFSDTADAIYVETGYGYSISLTLQDSHAVSDYALGLRVFDENAPWVELKLKGTNYIQDKSQT